MEKIRQRRHGAETWRRILGRFEESGITVPAFCARERISRQSLYRWRSRLGGESDQALVAKAVQLTNKTSGFIDLGDLQALTRHAMGRDPLDGALYVFVNRRGSQVKCLYFDRSGFCIWGKRLEAGKFISDWTRVRTREMDWTGLKLLLEGMEGRQVRKRYALPSAIKGL